MTPIMTHAKNGTMPGRAANGRGGFIFTADKIRYVPSTPALSPGYLLQGPRGGSLPFPLCAENGLFFYRARIGIYQLFRALSLKADDLVLVPDYHSGGEVGAIQGAGANIHYYPIRRNLDPDFESLERLCRTLRPRVLFIIHYLGWPQKISELMRLCREYGMLLIEDCALSMFAQASGKYVGMHGDYAIFCLYKTLPVPNGGILIQNGPLRNELANLELRHCGLRPIVGRSTDLFLEWFRSRFNRAGAAAAWAKAVGGEFLSTLGVEPVPIGNVGFEAAHLDLGMSSFSRGLLKRFDYVRILESRRNNYQYLHERLAGHVTLLDKEMTPEVCPLYFPILVENKASAAKALRKRGISAIEFWNYGAPGAAEHENPDVRFLRRHVLELPVHQDLDPGQLDYMVKEIKKVVARLAN